MISLLMAWLLLVLTDAEFDFCLTVSDFPVLSLFWRVYLTLGLAFVIIYSSFRTVWTCPNDVFS